MVYLSPRDCWKQIKTETTRDIGRKREAVGGGGERGRERERGREIVGRERERES